MQKIEGYLFSDQTKVSVEIENGIIKKLNKIDFFAYSEDENLIIAPALIDNQINGYMGTEFTFPDLSPEDMHKIVGELYKKGVGTFLPTVITASHESLITSFRNLSAALKDEYVNTSVPGFHLEGPYLSNEAGYRGVHSLKQIRLPDWDEFQQLNEAAEGKILQITLAPELDGAIDFINKCVKNNVIVSLGHHNAKAAEIKRAVDAGAKTVTHLGNGCANMINRFNNPFWMQLIDDRLMSSLIVDGFHLPPELVQVFYKMKGNERIILTSDMTMLAGMPPGEYKWDGKDVVLTEEGLLTFPEENVFAGASLPLISGVSNIMRFTNCSLESAINMATRNPAILYGFKDRGTLEVGKRADLILFTMENDKLDIKETIIAGEVLYNVEKLNYELVV
ncbi:N-acetylglucosamine-6-phosphate deacetylase [bacterium]|nr:N-acetylglucosamine-6-phosphate deacetylase [bacterium]